MSFSSTYLHYGTKHRRITVLDGFTTYYSKQGVEWKVSQLEMRIKKLENENTQLQTFNTQKQIQNELLQAKNLHLESRFKETMKVNHGLRQALSKHAKAAEKRKAEIIDEKSRITKRIKVTAASATETGRPQNSPSEEFFYDIMERKKNNRNFPFTKRLRGFAFNCHYYSPALYLVIRDFFDKLLPHPGTILGWTSFVDASPGMMYSSLNDIAKTNKQTKKLYSVAIDELAMRNQLIFDGEKLIGFVDGGGVTEPKNPTDPAKNAFFCLATEINGHKSLPICYTLNRGLTADDITTVVTKCLTAMHEAGGEVVSISFDGLPANFTAMKKLGANFDLETDQFKPYIEHPVTKEKEYLMPDASHMMKLVRNNFKSCQILKNGKDEPINWGYINRLEEIQSTTGVRAANKLTKKHVQFENQKMKTKLCVQALSHSVATAIGFCRKIGVDGFHDSEATSEFLDICDKLFDILNSKSRGYGLKTPLKNSNYDAWGPFLESTKLYLLSLKCKPKNRDEFVKIHTTTRGTFVKGLVTTISSVQMIMQDIASGKIKLEYLPTYRQSQDPLELLFGKIRLRLGCNNNPNIKHLEQSLKGILSHSINACTTGNCIEQDTFSNQISPTRFLRDLTAENGDRDKAIDASSIEAVSENVDFNLIQELPSFGSLSLFVDNVIVYISGFVAKSIMKTMKCEVCKHALLPFDLEEMRKRSDFTLLNDKNRGGLCCPSEDLVKVCRVAETKIRTNLAGGLKNVSSSLIQNEVIQTCLEFVFQSSYHDHSDTNISNYYKMIGHKSDLVRAITKSYCNIRLHYVAGSSTLESCVTSKRSFHNKLGHFKGY